LCSKFYELGNCANVEKVVSHNPDKVDQLVLELSPEEIFGELADFAEMPENLETLTDACNDENFETLTDACNDENFEIQHISQTSLSSDDESEDHLSKRQKLF